MNPQRNVVSRFKKVVSATLGQFHLDTVTAGVGLHPESRQIDPFANGLSVGHSIN